MITVVDGLNAHENEALLRDFYRLRARTFRDRLGWDVQVVDGEERDIFDMLDPAYLIALNPEGEVVGGLRILQTTGPNMLADVFSELLDGEPAPRSPQIWESTRFCIDTERLRDKRGPNSITHATSELMIAACEYAMAAGVTDAVTVVDAMMHRVLKWSGNAPSGYVGSPRQIGKVVALAVLLDCTQERIDRIRAHSGITHDVFALAPTTTPGAVAARGTLLVA